MVPATKDRKSRFLPYLNSIVTSANTPKQGTSTGKKAKHPPPPLDLVSVSLTTPTSDDSPILVHPTNAGQGVKKANKRNPWRLWGNDMSHLRLKTGGFVHKDMWTFKCGDVDVEEELDSGEEEVFGMEEDAGRKWSLGGEWEVVEVE